MVFVYVIFLFFPCARSYNFLLVGTSALILQVCTGGLAAISSFALVFIEPHTSVEPVLAPFLVIPTVSSPRAAFRSCTFSPMGFQTVTVMVGASP